MKEKLMEIGIETASLWGAECISYKVDKIKEEVVFDCIEHGKRFYTSWSFEELKERYNLKIS